MWLVYGFGLIKQLLEIFLVSSDYKKWYVKKTEDIPTEDQHLLLCLNGIKGLQSINLNKSLSYFRK